MKRAWAILWVLIAMVTASAAVAQSLPELDVPDAVGGSLRSEATKKGKTPIAEPKLAAPGDNRIERRDLVIPQSALTPGGEIKPFGAQLFGPGNLIDRSLGVNEAYTIRPGDRIEVRIWGAWAFDNVLTVDIQGNIFLPEIGPIKVAGARNAQLTAIVKREVARIFRDNVNVYTNLLGTQPIGVFVSGNVPRPGRYPGERVDSVLYYLARAGGIDLASGSFRDVRVIRNGAVIARIDLYRFLLEGVLPTLEFRNNDTVFVGPQQPLVTVDGAVRNRYAIELDPQRTRGRQIIAIARPAPDVSHVLVTGLREGRLTSLYVPLAEYAPMAVHEGDRVEFFPDRERTRIVVSVEGNAGGPSTLTVPRAARLGDVARLIEIDPAIADTDALYLRRRSVAERQKQALERALYELQRSVLTGASQSATGSQIRVQEAELVDRFVQSVRPIEPEGRVVVAGTDWSSVQLEDGDVVVVPRLSDVVLVSGEVNVPQTVLWRPGYTLRDYIAAAGGLSNRGDSSNVLVIRADGSIHDGREAIAKGDHVMILPKPDEKTFAIYKDLIEVIYRVALSAAVVLSVN